MVLLPFRLRAERLPALAIASYPGYRQIYHATLLRVDARFPAPAQPAEGTSITLVIPVPFG
ncbi:MAG: hypothetical protein ABIG68_09900, partial [Acidobacteriota bacterium]